MMNIAIWGLGVSGLSALGYLHSKKHRLFAINQGEPEQWVNLEKVLAYTELENCFDEADPSIHELKLDQIILSPGVDRKSSLVKYFIDAGVEVIGEVELASRKCALPIVAITGTNGKTTTTTMIAECLELAGKRVFCCGNIGTPFCDFFNYELDSFDIVVIELSSFQLESMVEFRANIAILLNIEPSHMERYDCFKDYADAKLNIFKRQKDTDLAIAPHAYLTKGAKELERITGVDLSKTHLMGDHHLYNLFCVLEVLKFFAVSKPLSLLERFLATFKGVQFRLEYLGVKEGISFYNDSKSTNLHSTLSACLSMGANPFSLIIGGKLRDDKVEIADILKGLDIQKILAFGEAKDLILAQTKEAHKVIGFDSLSDVIEYVWQDKGCAHVLFSPGFPSFDQYKNYIDRGESFNRLVGIGM